MSSPANEPDLTLLPSVPGFDFHHHTGLLPAALYTIVELSPEAFIELQDVCESEYAECGGDFTRGQNVAPAPRSHFVGEPLQAVVDYHVRIRQEQGSNFQLDPRWFIVAFHQDWNKHGVLLVTLDSDALLEVPNKPDAFRMRAKHSGIIFAGLQVANTAWEEAKDYYELRGPGAGWSKADEEDEE
ncbi:hypothetical protein QBC43DRAFT_327003 [Cladorrhinum sp. PSN259]|nr:hypothetical protein QBC43DRAFT_327003 [Cladorrhinum sp. PSN259]